MRRLLLVILASTWLPPPVIANTSQASEHPHWSYSGNSSPEYWGDLHSDFAECKVGTLQSPVDLSPQPNIPDKRLTLSYVKDTYKVENNEHALEARPLGAEQKITIGDLSYTFKQFHFHTPSEHTFSGRYFPMEAHFVHQSEQGNFAVLGVMFKEGKPNHALTPLIAKKLQTGESFNLDTPLDVLPLLPEDRRAFFLKGSLTTPPCSENVKWIVFKTPIKAGAEQIKAMSEIIGKQNNRPIQPLNDRQVSEDP